MKTAFAVAVALSVAFLAALTTLAVPQPAWARDDARIPPIAAAQLPAEARDTLALIRQGGPYPYRQDDAVFGNRERLLPRQPRGYYREYTVRTPGERSRGARRIIAGGTPPREFFYTDDHYRSYQRVAQ